MCAVSGVGKTSSAIREGSTGRKPDWKLKPKGNQKDARQQAEAAPVTEPVLFPLPGSQISGTAARGYQTRAR